jgi:Protein of unknown function (DUF3313)
MKGTAMHSRNPSFAFSDCLVRFVTVAAITILATCAMTLSGCSTTQPLENPIIQRDAPRAVPAFSGFLGDYTKLQVGGENQAAYRYVNPSVNWSQYHAVIVAPVTFWGSDNSKVSPEDQETLCDYFRKSLIDHLGKTYQIVDQPGPGVMKIEVALVDPEAATPVLRTASVIIPQARLLSRVKQFATGSFSFVGGARAEAKITDSQSGEILAEAVDERMGGNSLQTAATWQWGDVERVMDYWSELMDKRLSALTSGSASGSPA